MKGIILNLVEDAVVSEYGEPAWDDLLDTAGLDGAYTSLGNYPDDHLGRLVAAGAKTLGLPVRQLSVGIGERAVRGLAERYPHHFAAHRSLRPFLLSLDEVIHAEVRKLYPEASPPAFWFSDVDRGVLDVHYRSTRRQCALAEGMIRGAGAWFGQSVEITHTSCMLEGADHCTMRAGIEKG